MFFNLLKYLFYNLVYTPPSARICANGYHEWGEWQGYAFIHEIRFCNKCGKQQKDMWS